MAQKDATFPYPPGKDLREADEESMVVRGLNPAFRPLYSVISDFALVRFEDVKSLNLSVLSSSRKYLAREQVKTLRIALQYEINAFHGIASYSFSANSNRGIDASVSMVLGVCTQRVFNRITEILATWEAENRVALAEGKLPSLLQNIEEKLRYRDVFTFDYLEYFCASKRFLSRDVTFLAHSLEQFSVRDCNRLLLLITKWENGNNLWKSGWERSLKETIEEAKSVVLNDGTCPDYDEYNSTTSFASLETDTPEEIKKRLEAREVNRQALYDYRVAWKNQKSSPSPVTREALEKREKIAEVLREDFSRFEKFIKDPFVVLPTLPEFPQWIKNAINETGGEDRLTPAVHRENFQRERIALHLIATHTAIRRFRWEHDRLPRSLAELNLPKWTKDPPTGKPLLYSLFTENETYTLQSVGFVQNDYYGKPDLLPIDLMTEPLPEIGE